MTNLAKHGMSLAPTTFAELERFAKYVSDSDFCPKEFRGKPGACIVAMTHGAELGLAPTAALQNIAVINGKPSIYGDAALAVVRSHPRFAAIVERAPDVALAKGGGECTITTRDGVSVTRTFSTDDAKRAGLSAKPGPWSQYPGRMLQMRARSLAMRDALPEALKGIAIREEVEDFTANPVIATHAPDAPAPAEEFIDVESAPASGEMSDAEKALASVLERIEAAQDEGQLLAVVDDKWKSLDGAFRERARKAFAERKAVIAQ